MARTGTTTTTNDACNALAAGSLTGKVVLIQRGTCTFTTKALNAQAAGALAVMRNPVVLLYSTARGDVSSGHDSRRWSPTPSAHSSTAGLRQVPSH